jgi:hypothetical protein
VAHVSLPLRSGRLLLAPAAAGGADGAAPVLAAASLMQRSGLLGSLVLSSAGTGTGDARETATTSTTPAESGGGGGGGVGRYLAHAPLEAATVLQGAEGLRGTRFAHSFTLDRPVLLVTEAAVVLFSAGGLEAVVVLPLNATGAVWLSWADGRAQASRDGPGWLGKTSSNVHLLYLLLATRLHCYAHLPLL